MTGAAVSGPTESRTPAAPAPAFAVRARPKFREVVLPPGPPPIRRVPAPAGYPDAAPGRDDPERFA